MKIRKTFRFLFMVFALVLSFQMVGVEELFCDEPILETDCHDCVACLLTSCEILTSITAAPAPFSIQYLYLQEPAFKIENVSFGLLRPPIFL